MIRILAAWILAAGLLSLAAQAHEYQAGELTIDHPWIQATPKGAPTAGGYMTITNAGSEADRLIGGSAEGAAVFEVHQMLVENNVMRMRRLDGGLEIGPGETVELKPGSFHLMLMKLETGYEEGVSIEGSLIFERAGTVPVEFKVEPIGGPKGEDDSAAHGHGHESHNH